MGYPYTPNEKWDVHTHTTLSPDTYEPLAKFSHYEHFVRIRAHTTKPCCSEMVNSKGEVRRVIQDDAYNGEVRIHTCDKHGVSVQVLSPTPMMIPDYVDNEADASDICKILNDSNMAIAEKNPARFRAIGALPMMFADSAIKELERLKSMGIHGVEINSNVNDLELDDPRFFPIFEAAAEMGMAIFIHPWGGFMFPTEERIKKRMSISLNWRPWLLGMALETGLAFDAMRSGGVHERLPHLRVLYAHGGGMFPTLLGRLEHGSYCRQDIFTDASKLDPFQTVKNCGVYTDTLTHNPWALDMLVNMLGANRVAMGSDYPYPLGEVDPFDAETKKDPLGNICPFSELKGIYPGHMIEHLPESAEQQEQAWQHFNWLPRKNAAGERHLPYLTTVQKQQILSGTAKEWLGCS
jgi:aminocarboxymuconate-semialdehyde decarboxylase